MTEHSPKSGWDPGANQTGPPGHRSWARRAAWFWGIGILFAAFAVGAGYVFDVLLLVFAGILLAVFLRSLADLLNRYARLGPHGSLAVVMLLLAGAAVAVVGFLAPSISHQVDQLQRDLPQAVDRLRAQVEQYPGGRWVLARAPAPGSWLPQRHDPFARITGVVSGVLGALGSLVLFLFVGVYLAVNPQVYLAGIARLAPTARRPRVRQVLAQVGATLQWWLVGKFLSMAIVGVLTGVGLWLLGVRLAVTLAVLAALLTFIPNFGPILAALPAVLMGLLHGPWLALWVVLLYVGVQTVESYLLTPLIQQRTVSLPPALIIVAQLVMGVLGGALGLALATPLVAALLVLVREAYVRDVLGDREASPP